MSFVSDVQDVRTALIHPSHITSPLARRDATDATFEDIHRARARTTDCIVHYHTLAHLQYYSRHPRASSVLSIERVRAARLSSASSRPSSALLSTHPTSHRPSRDVTRRDATRSSHARLRFDPFTPRWRPPPRAPSLQRMQVESRA